MMTTSLQNGQNPNDVSVRSSFRSDVVDVDEPPAPDPSFSLSTAPDRSSVSPLTVAARIFAEASAFLAASPSAAGDSATGAADIERSRFFLCVPARARDGVVASGATERASSSSSSSASRIAGPTRGGTVSRSFGSRPFAPAVVPVSVAAPAPARRVFVINAPIAASFSATTARHRLVSTASSSAAASTSAARQVSNFRADDAWRRSDASSAERSDSASATARSRASSASAMRRSASSSMLPMSFSYSSTRTRTTPPGWPFAGECAITADTAHPRAPVCRRPRPRIGTSRDFVTSTFVRFRKKRGRRVWPSYVVTSS